MALWPLLERRIRRAMRERSLEVIPIARMVLQAEDLALSVHRTGVVLKVGR